MTRLQGWQDTRRGLVLAFLFLLLALPAVPTAAQTDPDDPPPLPTPPADRPDQTFGAVETYHTPELADEAKIGWTRIIFYWSELKKDGPATWNEHHAPYWLIDREIEGGREVVGLLQHTPDFATEGSIGSGVPEGLYLPVDDPGNLWAVFVREVVTRYDGRIDRWIVWNEPDIPPDTFGTLWEGSPADYYQLVKVAYLAAHEVNPEVKIHLGGLTYWHNPTYLREFLAAASQDLSAAEHGYYFDVVSLHVYFKPETTVDIVASLRAQLAEFGLSKPIWLNETNAPPFDDPAQPWDQPVFQVTQDMQASFLIQEAALALASDVERIAVYKWIDEPPLQPGFEPYGLLRTDRTPRPAFDAFEVVVTHYANTVDALALDRPELRQVFLNRGQQTTRVLWLKTPAGADVSVPALSDEALLVDRFGQETYLEPRGGAYLLHLDGAPCPLDVECLMGGPPLVLVEQAPLDLIHWPHAAASLSVGSDPVGSTDFRSARAFPVWPLVVASGVGLAVWGVWLLRQH